MTSDNIPATVQDWLRLKDRALAAAVERSDLTVMENLLAVLSQPFQDPPEEAGYHLPAPPSEKSYRTFCGT